MRSVMMCFLFALIVVACQPDDAVPNEPAMASDFNVVEATLLKQEYGKALIIPHRE